MLTLRPITRADITAIASWPPYPERFSELDYALRSNGWLAEFYGKTDTHCDAVEKDGELVGFTLLIKTAPDCAEIRIALHPEQLGRGYGAVAMRAALGKGFSALSLARIYLIVRKDNHSAFALYSRLGFAVTGECEKEVRGKTVAFYAMELLNEATCATLSPAPGEAGGRT